MATAGPSDSTRKHSSDAHRQCMLTGLVNLGNTCYMSALLQCLSHTDRLRNYFLEEPIESIINFEGPESEKTNGFAAFHYGFLVRQLWSNKFNTVRYFSLKDVFGRLNQEFAHYQQCDASELLTYFLDAVHQDLNKPQLDTLLGTALDSITGQAAYHWAETMRQNNSIVYKLFFSQRVRTLYCARSECNKPRYNFEASNIIYAEFGPNPEFYKTYTLHELLGIHFAGEHAEAESLCPHCNQMSIPRIDMKMWSLPDILVIQIKRYTWAMLETDTKSETDPIPPSYESVKIKNAVDLSMNKPFDMSSFCHPENEDVINTTYELYGVVHHHGETLTSGHYIADTKTGHGMGLGWHEFNDSQVTPFQRDINSKTAYILFYRRIEP